ncbi:MAG: ribonuclease P protein component [Synergistaceae bacterium]|jgi:ribonuclease P protein component|nr:ribonuclease P protein component [Synergistaceae bacterium]
MTDRAVPFSFASSMRLKSSWEFDTVFRAGRQLKGELVRIRFLYGECETKVGVAVGKKIAPAVGRVRGRRILRESLRRLLPWIKEGVWLVATLREHALGFDAVSVYYDAAALLKRAGLLKKDWNGADWRVDDRRISQEIRQSRS